MMIQNDAEVHLAKQQFEGFMISNTDGIHKGYERFQSLLSQLIQSPSCKALATVQQGSTTGGCQFLGRRLITWQCKKQTIVATSTTEAEYVAAASCCGQVLWIQNQMLDYGFNFMNTKIYIDNESTICIVKNPVYHSKTKHIAIRHHFIRDAYEKKLIQFKSKKIAQVVRAWIKSKNSLVKHFEDMSLFRPFKEYLHVWFNPPRDVSMSCLTTKRMHTIGVLEVMLVNALRRFGESLRRVSDGAEAFLILTLFIFCLDKVSTDSAKLVPLGQVCTAKETLEKNTAKAIMAALESCPKHNMIAYLEKTEGNVEFHEVIDFLRRSYIYHALTVTARCVLSLRHPSETDLIFDDADGIDSLPNQAIFNAIQLMGYEGDLTVPFEQHPDPSPSPSPKPSPRPSPTPIVSDSIPEHAGENLRDHSYHDSNSLSGNEDTKNSPNVYDLPKGCNHSESKVSTDEQVEGTEETNEGSEEIFESTEKQREGTEDKVSTDEQMEGTEDQTKEENASKASQTSTQTPTSMTFGDDETIATLLINMSKAKAASKEKEKGVELKDVEDIDRPRPTSTRSLLTLKPLPKI
ncbi:hypothetical protein Tco_0656372 [Tanacetum coccineum]|uniref:Uncharacterized protein n=1 Tax=Tanacetum coccineum TaxID=301880 RepID=A0ABQ4X8K3_9ASTR